MKRREGQEGARWLALVDKKELAKQLRTMGFKVIGKSGEASQGIQGREILQKEWSGALDAAKPSNKVGEAGMGLRETLETSGLSEVIGVM